jgi:hypothetical protein
MSGKFRVPRANRTLETRGHFDGIEKAIHRPASEREASFHSVIKKPLTIDAGWMNFRCSQVRIQVDADCQRLVQSIACGSVDRCG